MPLLNLALQGGGSHGAFTWGVLDALLADPRIDFEGISGTSAGALNAAALASGYAKGLAQGKDPRAEARAALARLWQEVGELGALGALATFPAQLAAKFWGTTLSPYQANPLNVNPVLGLIERDIDFDAVAKGPIRVFVSATHVRIGKAVIFTGRDLTAKAVMASACLPMLFQSIEIDGEHYWDGGFAVNPAMTPLIEACRSADLLLVQINPLKRDELPQTAADIADRIGELTFNASLLTQMRSIDLINQLIADGALKDRGMKSVRLHRIDGGTAMAALPASTRTQADAALIQSLFEVGRHATHEWLKHHFDAIGHHGTVDIRKDYLDDTRDEIPSKHHEPARGFSFRPWLAKLLRRGARHG